MTTNVVNMMFSSHLAFVASHYRTTVTSGEFQALRLSQLLLYNPLRDEAHQHSNSSIHTTQCSIGKCGFLSKKKSKSTTPLGRRRPLGRVIASIFKFIIVYTTFFIMRIMNKTFLHDPNCNLRRYAFHRNDTDLGLLTISNHVSVIDDPGLWCGILPLRKLTLENMRNIVMVEDAYYRLGKFSALILHGLNCLPIRRGDIRGLESPQLKELHDRLTGKFLRKEWCHIMVEGRICQPWRFNSLKENLPHICKFRLGAAKLIASSSPSKTIVLPIYHYGLHNVFPETPPEDAYTLTEDGSRLIATRMSGKTKIGFPRWGNRIDVYVGDPIDFTDLVPEEGYAFERTDKRELLSQINERLYNAMLQLEAKASKQRSLD